MEIEFDPAKDETNIAKHGLSLLAAERFDWETAFEREDDRFDYGEVRFVALGMIGDRLHVLVFTEGSHDEALLQTLVTAGQRHPVWGSGSIGKMLIEHVHGLGHDRGANAKC
ncbi:BrnT family toxin, partial [Altericroceibacterium spongiae]